MTEDQARTKWCPFSRVEASNRFILDAHEGWHPGCRCIASDCAVWRWQNDPDDGQGYCGLMPA